jgi:hypothetical protein
MRKSRLAIVAILIGIAIAALGAGTASANPTGLRITDQRCAADGTVSAVLRWSPDGTGQQFVDLASRNDNFATVYATGGPYSNTTSQVNFTSMQPSTTYHTRVNTLIGSQFFRSATLTFTTRSCVGGSGGGGNGSVSAPSNLQAAALSATRARFQWVPGNGNRYFCVDYARNVNDLVNRVGTWRNSGCGTTGNSHTVSGLACGTIYYARVWTSAGGGLYSGLAQVATQSCSTVISPPTNIEVESVTKTTATVDWTRGKANRWFCVDTARTQSDLLNYTGTWRNHDCWTSDSFATIGGLSCGKLYYLRVYAWNEIANVHSDFVTFQTAACQDSDLVEAPIVDVDVSKVGNNYFADIVAALPNGCHSFASYLVERQGNFIDITVLNSVANTEGCEDTYSTYELSINLGSNFTSGQTYTVSANDDESDTFTAN